MPTKKVALAIFSIGPILKIISIGFSYTGFDACYASLECRNTIIESLTFLAPYATVLTAIFLTAILMYFVKDLIYRTWIKFVYIWIPITFILIFIAPELAQGSLFAVNLKVLAALTFSILFVIISIFIMAIKSAFLWWKKK